MRLSPPGCLHWKIRPITLAAGFFFMAVCVGEAGTWSSMQWTNDADLPKPTPELVTHAIAFGVELEPPAPAPFQITKEISGENWTIWRMPEHTVAVTVTRRGEKLLDDLKVDGEGEVLLRGRLVPKGKSEGLKGRGGLAIELSGLEPGRKYTLAVFGLGFLAHGHGASSDFLMKATASDAPDKPEVLKSQAKGGRFWAYEYTAPPDGQITVSFENGASDSSQGVVRFCAFLNCRVE